MIVDRDTVEEDNLPKSPLFSDSDIGKPKAQVAAEKLRALDPHASVNFVVGDIQWDVGLSNFIYADIVLGAVDSRLARQQINNRAWLTDTPFIDGGIDGQSLTGRIQAFIPQRGPCLECSWYPRDYQLLEREYPCTDNAGRGAPTISTIAAVISSLEVNEALKLLLGMDDHLEPGKELRWDLMHNSCIETQIPRRLSCCFDHDSVIRETVPLPEAVEQLTLGQLFEFVSEHTRGEITLEFSRDIVTSLVCDKCRTEKGILRALGKITPEEMLCDCSGCFHPRRFVHSLERHDLENGKIMELSLREIGIPDGDIISAYTTDSSEEMFFEFPGALTGNKKR
jgi:adenylyltransferase/sulfurtransferase